MLLSVAALNQYLVCKLCDGYYREAHTIPECHHTFCKCCLFREFKKVAKGMKQCPTCHNLLGPNAENKCVYDHSLQSCVDKLFPAFHRTEMEINNSRAKEKKNLTGSSGLLTYGDFNSMDIDSFDTQYQTNEVKICVVPMSQVKDSEKLPPLKRMTLKIEPGVTIARMQMYIHKRLQAEGVQVDPNDIEVFAGNALLDPLSDLTACVGSWMRALASADPGRVLPLRKHVQLEYRRRS